MSEPLPSPGQAQPVPVASRRSAWLRMIVCPVIASLIILGVLGLAWWLRQRELCANRASAIEANHRGIVLIEQFHSQEAISEFEEAVRRDPDWLPGRINLGIALLDAGGDDSSQLSRCRSTFEEVLRRDPDNPHAHFCLGILLLHKKDTAEAMGHFQAVLDKDPHDAYSWCWLGTLKEPDSDEQTKCFRQALKRNRHLGSAIYGLAKSLRFKDPKAFDALIEEYEALKQSDWTERATIRYGEMGPYARVIGQVSDPCNKPRIGPLPRFLARPLQVQLAGGARWATAADLGADAVAEVRRRVRARFGATLVVLDYNRDGRPDLFLAGAVREKGQVRDLLLRHDPNGQFTDVTAAAGLAGPQPTLGCVVADFDNDRWPDLLLTGVGVQKLFRNTGEGTFEDVTAKAGLDKLTSVCLGASVLDLNHDGNSDLLLCENAGGFAVFLNIGTAPEVEPDARRPALTCGFRRWRDIAGLKDEIPGLTNITVSDIESDGDLDLIVFTDHASPGLMRNDRLQRFHHQPHLAADIPAADWNGALVLDADHDGRSDLVLVGAGQAPRLLLNRVPLPGENEDTWYTVQTLVAPPLRQAFAADIDLDSWTDVVGVSEDGRPILLHNRGGRLEVEAAGFGSDLPNDVAALTVCDLDGDSNPDVIMWSEAQGLQLLENQGNGNHGLSLELLCLTQRVQGGDPVRCSVDGFGAHVMVHAGTVYASQELATQSAGLAQSRQPFLLGLGDSARADAIRLRWPDGTWQAERAFLAGRRSFIEWKQRKIFW